MCAGGSIRKLKRRMDALYSLLIYYLSAKFSPFSCSQNMDMGPLNVFLLPVAQLNTFQQETWERECRRNKLCFLVPVCSLGRLLQSAASQPKHPPNRACFQHVLEGGSTTSPISAAPSDLPHSVSQSGAFLGVSTPRGSSSCLQLLLLYSFEFPFFLTSQSRITPILIHLILPYIKHSLFKLLCGLSLHLGPRLIHSPF